MTQETRLRCTCGRLHLEVTGAPIMSSECCCDSCREAAARLQALPAAPSVSGESGMTRFVLYRKDRVRFLEGADVLRELRLTPASPTRRVVASCCNTPVFLEFEKGHWLSLYGCLWPEGTLPRLELRTMAGDLPVGAALPDDVPNNKTHSFGFFVKLLGAWMAMGFRSPKITVDGDVHV